MTLDDEGFELSSTVRLLRGPLRVIGKIPLRRFAWGEVSEIYRVRERYFPAFFPPGLHFEIEGSSISWWSRTEAGALEVLDAVEALAPPGKLRDRTVRDRR